MIRLIICIALALALSRHAAADDAECSFVDVDPQQVIVQQGDHRWEYRFELGVGDWSWFWGAHHWFGLLSAASAEGTQIAGGAFTVDRDFDTGKRCKSELGLPAGPQSRETADERTAQPCEAYDHYNRIFFADLSVLSKIEPVSIGPLGGYAIQYRIEKDAYDLDKPANLYVVAIKDECVSFETTIADLGAADQARERLDGLLASLMVTRTEVPIPPPPPLGKCERTPRTIEVLQHCLREVDAR